jgi:phospholipid/cholesterol/gamma-HCH transport system substrate-binding protein
MSNKAWNSVRLGAFVLTGLLFLILLLYVIGRNQNIFGHNFQLKARFENVQGLVAGNNVRFGGITVGTVKQIRIINDTTIEVTLTMRNDMKQVIRRTAVVSIGTDGLMGNKVVNILPSRVPAQHVEEYDVLATVKSPDTDDMLRTLQKTNQDVAVIAAVLKVTIMRINNSTALWKLMNDETLPENVRSAGINVQRAMAQVAAAANDLQHIVQQVKEGKGSVGALLADTAFAHNLNTAIGRIDGVGKHAGQLAQTLDSLAMNVQHDLAYGKGTVNALFKDSGIVIKLNASLDNIQKGTDAFSQNMEALKHNFFFRGYFKKQERKKQKEGIHAVAAQ